MGLGGTPCRGDDEGGLGGWEPHAGESSALGSRGNGNAAVRRRDGNKAVVLI